MSPDMKKKIEKQREAYNNRNSENHDQQKKIDVVLLFIYKQQ